MKITVNGDVTPGAVGAVLEDLEKEYGLKIRDLTMYIRLIDENGRVVEPKLQGNGSELVMTISKEEKGDVVLKDKQLSIEQLKAMLELHIGRPLSKNEMETAILWVNEFHVTYGELNRILIRNDAARFNFRRLDRQLYAMFKAKKEKEILKDGE